ncbi:ATP synthase F1 subunit gamma [Leptospira kmetyi]|uniref:ATP synthase gamma chain n=1 Tax=Leptospira kmetyi TaxID=408139 RepID=A0A2M9XK80_9LEPT|nr:ATP synthase F1 subunit gamma [Leptospira kmetyi]AYV55011.1 ATP synthase F1 subunit gamma [Leptospira kmetyi]EQA52616.1 ATP synthase F1, gamma subunit [Leptospira kmetyi serovar Malaysia str. Bejo-Iso9]PJZ29212.1 ATP synthase F1 subunit gamma [Leptospira kmetyi]PJZ39664.1 ATP synthase F1 subunit gamma [Leptospira kmetyi]TGL70218.1 ATP synthase F1 subunit gamma [Leptospira kmetyi]
MATPREIKKRITSVKNTRKITRTMEMVSTAKSKKISDRVNASHPFSNKIKELVSSLASLGGVVHSPFLRRPDKIKTVALLVITANRGLCGGYNSNVNRLAKAKVAEWKKAGVNVRLFIVGKKGISFFKFAGEKAEKTYTHLDDKSGYKEAEEFANLFLELFAKEEVDAVEIVSTVYYSSASQKPEVTRVLPFEVAKEGSVSDMIAYEPSPETVLESLLPLVVKTAFLKAILEANCSEQIARRIAMKSATDAASEMIKLLTRGYNRVRQAKITQEISEIVAGADSLN